MCAAQTEDTEILKTHYQRLVEVIKIVALKRAGAGVEPARSQLLLSKHTHSVAKSSMSVSQSGKKGHVEEPLEGQNELRGGGGASEIRRVPRSFNVMLYYFLISWRQKAVLVCVCACTCTGMKLHRFF